jgi:erythromycin esterase-like protein
MSGGQRELDALMSTIGEARFVLIGEATHGTHEFYSTRAALTRRLIEEKEFTGVVAEADWPDAYRVNRYVRGSGEDESADAALSGFKRFPQWMWRNTDVLEFVGWLRGHNDSLPPRVSKCGFYGMDLYSMYQSIEAVLNYLERVDPAASKRARYRYSCFDHAREDAQAYGYAANFELTPSCEQEVLQQLMELQSKAGQYVQGKGPGAGDEYFFAEQNARLVRNAEQYYRTMFSGRVSSWNLRDRHMVETLDALARFMDQRVGRSKFVVWAHNSHLGDARATEMGEQGEWNVGQLVRERYPGDCFNIGFTTHEGTVTAASEWDGPAEQKRVRPSMPDSYERVFHEAQASDFMLILRDQAKRDSLVPRRALERAIGVIYLPRTERVSHYFHADLARQFDAVIHCDRTTALHPLERTPQWDALEEVPETYPVGL